MPESYRIANQTLTVEISGLGARVEQIHWHTHHRNWLHAPSTDDPFVPFIFGIQPLFPPGRIAHGEFSIDGHQFHWPINDNAGPSNLHGFGWDVEWTVVEKKSDSVTLRLDDQGSQNSFGGPFSLTICYRLDGDSFLIHTEMQNRAAIPLPAALGFHTNIALHDDNYLCHFPAMEPWEINANKVPTGRKLPPQAKKSIPARLIVEDTPYHIQDGQSTRVTLTSQNGTFEAQFEGNEQFRQFVLYRPSADAQFFSIEPYSWLPNAPNLALPDTETGMTVVYPDEQIGWDYAIHFRSLASH